VGKRPGVRAEVFDCDRRGGWLEIPLLKETRPLYRVYCFELNWNEGHWAQPPGESVRVPLLCCRKCLQHRVLAVPETEKRNPYVGNSPDVARTPTNSISARTRTRLGCVRVEMLRFAQHDGKEPVLGWAANLRARLGQKNGKDRTDFSIRPSFCPLIFLSYATSVRGGKNVRRVVVIPRERDYNQGLDRGECNPLPGVRSARDGLALLSKRVAQASSLSPNG